MRKFQTLINSLLLVTSPSLLAYPQCECTIEQQASCQETPFNSFNPTYDEILTLLQNIEEGNVEGYSDESVEDIRHFVTALAQQGMLPREYAANIEMQNDIVDLYADEDPFGDYAYYCGNALEEYSILPAVFLRRGS